ncbi:MAG: beta-lactamase family protein [Candidatus Heimdallarchaeota archaeon]|nr:beta-lactamase family protein [Candidatus Heimdallarchaeota archaeon]
MRSILIIIILLSILPVQSELDFADIITQYKNHHEMQDLSVAIVTQDRIIHLENEDQSFLLGSVTKSFTAILLLHLQEQGKIDLRANISEFLPFHLINPYHPMEIITAEMLLTHTSGLSKDNDGKMVTYYSLVFSDLMTRYGNVSRYPQWLAEYVLQVGYFFHYTYWNTSKPGTIAEELQYSNMGYSILGYLIEVTANMTYEDALHYYLMDELSMKNTGVYSNYSNLQIYDKGGTAIENVMINERGAASMVSTAGDMAKYLQFHLQKENGIVSLSNLHTNYPGQDYGYGWYTLNGMSGHGGDIFGSHAFVGYDTNTQIGYFAATNYLENGSIKELIEELRLVNLSTNRDSVLPNDVIIGILIIISMKSRFNWIADSYDLS